MPVARKHLSAGLLLVWLGMLACSLPALPAPDAEPSAQQSNPNATLLPAFQFTLTHAALTSTAPVPTEPLTSTPTTEPSSTPVPSDTPVPPTPTPSPTETPLPTPLPPPVVFAAIGDYGTGDGNAEAVANLVHSWNPDLVITLGDNNYPVGGADTIDRAIGRFYHDFIHPYGGSFGAGAAYNRFFPSLGNHDLNTDAGAPYFNYFILPGNERYYDFIWGPVHFFCVNSNDSEPDGVGETSPQAVWLQNGLFNSLSAWNVVYFHFPPYSSGPHGPTAWMQWPFAAWGADLVLSGHDHTYERLDVGGIPYIVNGMGGFSIYSFEEISPYSLVRYNARHGALRVEASDQRLLIQFITRDGVVIDTYEMWK